METALPVIWFGVIALLWTGYLLLEGFDLGVGMHMLLTARSGKERRAMLNTIGPVWDGNEVWLITAIGGTFAAFPSWYSTLLSSTYLLVLVVLFGLIVRAVAIEWAGKGRTDRWRRGWDTAMSLASFIVAFGIGAMLALTTLGLPIDAAGERVGGAFAWATPAALLGGLAAVGFALAHASNFLALKTDGAVRHRAGSFSARIAPGLLVPMLVWAATVQLAHGRGWTWLTLGVALLAGVGTWWAAGRRREAAAFLGTALLLVASTVTVFGSAFPVVLPSSVDPAANLTVWNAAASPYALGVLTAVAAFGVPLVIGYQAWSYWVFRRRLSADSIPEAHVFAAAVRRR
ncbi:cytochrome d ubiquinol oxidase subunit II [Amnibacterium endophyticum]|uniref:Cytochrome d ubiquinol oxidase subunit II n=1 Tax=Amnibacterium endophyticum TaxID=2109337 RepID=A0ABW4LHX3_9MICO